MIGTRNGAVHRPVHARHVLGQAPNNASTLALRLIRQTWSRDRPNTLGACVKTLIAIAATKSIKTFILTRSRGRGIQQLSFLFKQHLVYQALLKHA